MLCSHSHSEETINRGHKTAIPLTHALICDELKYPGIPLKGGTIIVCVEKVSVTEQITSMHENQTCKIDVPVVHRL